MWYANRIMLSVTAALELMLQTVSPLAAEPLPLSDALGLTLTEDVRSDVDSPPFDKSQMDGFAMRAADVAAGTASLTIVERITAGNIPTKTVGQGQAAQIMTGAPLPPGADAVVKIEDCTVDGDQVRVSSKPVTAGQYVIRRGTNLRIHDRLLTAGTKLHPTHLGALAEIGKALVTVRRRPRVSVLATGDELVPVDQQPGPGQIRNSNESMLTAQIQACGAIPVPLGVARDLREELAVKIAAGLQHDVLVLSGGVSAGLLDLVPSELAAAGVRQVFHQIEMKPGKPLWFGRHAAANGRCCYVFGLPGNPVSSLTCFEVFVRTALRQMMGEAPVAVPAVPARLQHDHRQRRDRPTYHPARLSWTATGPEVSLVPWHGSSDMASTITANAMAYLPGEEWNYSAGETLPTTPWAGME